MQFPSGLVAIERTCTGQILTQSTPLLLSASASEHLTEDLKRMIQDAVVKMQGDLRDELNEEDITIRGVLGQGAFGTVLSWCELNARTI